VCQYPWQESLYKLSAQINPTLIQHNKKPVTVDVQLPDPSCHPGRLHEAAILGVNENSLQWSGFVILWFPYRRETPIATRETRRQAKSVERREEVEPKTRPQGVLMHITKKLAFLLWTESVCYLVPSC
jgi:hypothetical protein